MKTKIRILIYSVLILTLIIVSGYAIKKYLFVPKNNYEVAVIIRQQNEVNGDDLKAGDVLLCKKGENLPWSEIEKVSYLILKMRLSEKQAYRLTESVQEKLSKKEKKEALDDFEFNKHDLTNDELLTFKQSLDQKSKIIRARKYSIDMEKLQGLKQGDPLLGFAFGDIIFGWDIVSKN